MFNVGAIFGALSSWGWCPGKQQFEIWAVPRWSIGGLKTWNNPIYSLGIACICHLGNHRLSMRWSIDRTPLWRWSLQATPVTLQRNRKAMLWITRYPKLIDTAHGKKSSISARGESNSRFNWIPRRKRGRWCKGCMDRKVGRGAIRRSVHARLWRLGLRFDVIAFFLFDFGSRVTVLCRLWYLILFPCFLTQVHPWRFGHSPQLALALLKTYWKQSMLPVRSGLSLVPGSRIRWLHHVARNRELAAEPKARIDGIRQLACLKQMSPLPHMLLYVIVSSHAETPEMPFSFFSLVNLRNVSRLFDISRRDHAVECGFQQPLA